MHTFTDIGPQVTSSPESAGHRYASDVTGVAAMQPLDQELSVAQITAQIAGLAAQGSRPTTIAAGSLPLDSDQPGRHFTQLLGQCHGKFSSLRSVCIICHRRYRATPVSIRRILPPNQARSAAPGPSLALNRFPPPLSIINRGTHATSTWLPRP